MFVVGNFVPSIITSKKYKLQPDINIYITAGCNHLVTNVEDLFIALGFIYVISYHKLHNTNNVDRNMPHTKHNPLINLLCK